MTIAEAKKQYNHYLERYNNGVNYIDNEAKTEADVEKALKLFDAIMKELNRLLGKIEIYTQDEILNGFRGN